jgi:hypothetical protein
MVVVHGGGGAHSAYHSGSEWHIAGANGIAHIAYDLPVSTQPDRPTDRPTHGR